MIEQVKQATAQAQVHKAGATGLAGTAEANPGFDAALLLALLPGDSGDPPAGPETDDSAAQQGAGAPVPEGNGKTDTPDVADRGPDPAPAATDTGPIGTLAAGALAQVLMSLRSAPGSGSAQSATAVNRPGELAGRTAAVAAGIDTRSQAPLAKTASASAAGPAAAGAGVAAAAARAEPETSAAIGTPVAPPDKASGSPGHTAIDGTANARGAPPAGAATGDAGAEGTRRTARSTPGGAPSAATDGTIKTGTHRLRNPAPAGPGAVAAPPARAEANRTPKMGAGSTLMATATPTATATATATATSAEPASARAAGAAAAHTEAANISASMAPASGKTTDLSSTAQDAAIQTAAAPAGQTVEARPGTGNRRTAAGASPGISAGAPAEPLGPDAKDKVLAASPADHAEGDPTEFGGRPTGQHEQGLTAIIPAGIAHTGTLQSGPQPQAAAGTATAQFSLGVPIDRPGFHAAFAGQIESFALQGLQSAEILVTPRDMGPIRVELSMSGESLSVAFSAAHPETTRAIEQSLATLRTMLSEHGITLSQASVGTGAFGQPQERGAARSTSNLFRNRDGSVLEETSSLVDGPSVPAPRSRGPGTIDLFA